MHYYLVFAFISFSLSSFSFTILLFANNVATFSLMRIFVFVNRNSTGVVSWLGLTWGQVNLGMHGLTGNSQQKSPKV